MDSSPARGTRDVLPDEVALRDHAAAVLLSTYARYGYAHVETPAIETIAMLAGSQGGDNEKLIFKLLKRGKKLQTALASSGDILEGDLVDFGLRYDLTVPLARYFAHNHGKLPQPFKAIQIGPVFRAERPQKGRYRQFTQCDIDILGEPSLIAEIDLIAATTEALGALGLTDFSVRVNDRRILSQWVEACGVPADRHEAVFIALDKLDKLGWDGVLNELAAAGLDEATAAALRQRLAQLESVMAALVADGAADAETVVSQAGFSDAEPFVDLVRIQQALSGNLGSAGRVIYDPTLVRGMGYYTGSIFEIGVESLPFSLAGGGRYDRMIGRMLGRDVPACGFSIGFERLIMVLEQGLAAGNLPGPEAIVAVAVLCDPADPAAALQRAQALRADPAGYRVSLVAARPAKKRGKQLEELQRQGFSYFISPDAAGDAGSAADDLRPLDGGGTQR